jgi:uracil-DNA glycosylase family 4
MAWSERQRLMLQEMGIRLWAPVATQASATPVAEAVAPAPMVESAVANKRPPAAEAMAPVAATAPDARAAAIASMPWPALREAVAACTACSLCQGRKQTVFGVGHANAHWMIVGEAPGEQEDLKGEPFVGAAGHLLDNMLRALNLTRDAAPPERQVYIANTLKCRPPRNRNPEPEELASCEPFLMRQIDLIRPRLILAMGRLAVQALLRSTEPVGKLRGRVHRYQGVPLVVTYHPAYLLRNLADKSRAWDDLCLAAQTADAAAARA